MFICITSLSSGGLEGRSGDRAAANPAWFLYAWVRLQACSVQFMRAQRRV